ncbi:acetyl-CoA acetyltransferase [Pseudonocardia sp. HH130629-09]|uniref:acetyl-CoA acetyltransferase n=1 Tax=Pseudonocardia sp. HH130629-09 TaxID=1641402 RepID=UPI0006CB1085|nr:acetyl-CoA acetyltransferase [Pseudonocardia sp. HH130629-09]ALE82845.1 acetyl-CoA acetyltransferase [Pseudonocardia sp. HH130629-09]
MSLDPRTPVVVGVGEASERIGEPGYAALSPVGLGAAAAAAALADTGAAPSAVAAALTVVAGVRQFEMSLPGAVAPLGRADNYPRAVARRVGADPERAVLDVVGGQSPQRLVTEFAGAIARGEAGAALLVGAEAMSTVRRMMSRPTDERPDHGEQVGGTLEDRGYGSELRSPVAGEHGVRTPAGYYALCENARRARLGLGRDAYARGMGAQFAPFTRVAAGHPHAAAPRVRTAEELVTVDDRNRMITDPYPRFLVSRDQVNQGAAVVLTSVGTARDLGIAPERWVFLHGHADLTEKAVLDRPDLGAYPAAEAAVRHALELAGTGVDDLSAIDLYSCFPIAVSSVADPLGLAADDPRGLTVTGGLPFFGGPGNDYAMHAIAEVVRRLRADPGTYGLVGANGGFLSKYSAGVYSTRPTPWRDDDSAAIQARLDAVATVPTTTAADGAATVETWTVRHRRDGSRDAVVVGRLDDGGARFVGCGRDDELLELLAGDPAGAAVRVRPDGKLMIVTPR